MAHLGDGLNGYLDVENATLRAPRLEAVSNIGIANTSPEHAFSVGSNLYVSINSPDVLTVDGNVVCEGIKMGLIEILPSYDLAAVSNVGNVTQSTIQFANTTTAFVTSATIALGGHIIPTVDSAYDIGSAAFKIRDMYVSDDSLWIGDDTKLSVTGGELKFRKRNTGVVPKGITDMGGTSGAALTHAGVSDINDMKLHHWESYAKSVDATKTTKDIFTDDAENYETSAIKTFNTSNAMTIGTTKTFAAVCTEDASGGLKYYIDGYLQASLVLHQGQTYIFDLSSPTLVDHPFVFQTTNANDGTTDGTNYTSGITTTGAYGSTEKRTFVVPMGAPTTLYYYCTAHSGMGGSVSISSEAELIVSGGAEFLGTGTIKVPSGTTDQRPATGINGMLRYNSTTGYMEAYTASGWGSIATPPTIQTFSPTSVAGGDVTTQVFTITGAFFDAQTTIQLQGADNTLYDVTDFVFTNSGSIGFKMGTLASGQAANRPFKVVVTNGAGLEATSIATIGFSGLSWTSPAAGATLTTFLTSASATNTELAATDDIGGTNRTFSVPANNLPSPLALNASTGAITGTIGAAGTTSVTFRVTDNASGSTLDRTFNIVGVAPLYSFSSHTFNPGFTTIQNTSHSWLGPTLTQLTDAYTPTWTDNTNYLNVPTRGYQLWTVPQDGTYRIVVTGATGGIHYNSSASVNLAKRGFGGVIRGDITLTLNQKLLIAVGQAPREDQANWNFVRAYNETGWVAGAGGGGSFVTLGTTKANAVPILIAGGGGGASTGTSTNYRHGGWSYQTGSTSTTFNSTAATGGGNGGGAGGGFNTDGTAAAAGAHGRGFRASLQGGQTTSYGCFGSFGGGASGGGNPGGGGGGASGGSFGSGADGGASAGPNISGNGGTSYAATNVVSNISRDTGTTDGNGSGHGSVVITRIA